MAWSPWSSHRMVATPDYPWLPPLPPRDPATPPLAGGGGRGHHAPCRHSLIYLSKNNIPLCKSIPLPSIAPSAKTVLKIPFLQHQSIVQHIYPISIHLSLTNINVSHWQTISCPANSFFHHCFHCTGFAGPQHLHPAPPNSPSFPPES